MSSDRLRPVLRHAAAARGGHASPSWCATSPCGWCSAIRRSTRACGGSRPRCSTCARSTRCAPNVEALTHWLLDSLAEREEFDFIADFAGPLPALVIMDMLGVPREELRAPEAPVGRDGALHRQRARRAGQVRSAPRRRRARWRSIFRELVARAARGAAARPAERAGALDDARRPAVATTSWWRPACCCSSPATRPPRITSPTGCARCSLSRPSWRGCAASPRSRRPRSRSCCATTDRSARRCASCRSRTRCTARSSSAGERVFLLMNAANRDPRAYDGSRPARPRAQRRAASHLRLRRAHLPRLSARPPRRPDRAAGGARALAAHRARRRSRSSGSIRWCCAA